MLRLQLRRPGAPPEILALPGPLAVVGRHEGCDVVLADDAVSAVHARIELAGATVTVEDAGSRNGTRVDGRLLVAGESHPLAPGQLVEIAGFSLSFHSEGPAPLTGDEGTATLARHLLAQAAAPAAGPTLTVEVGPARGRILRIGPPGSEHTVGRDPAADLPLDDPDASRLHLRLRRDVAGVLAEEGGSKNGTRIETAGGPPAALDGAQRLADGARLLVGSSVLRFDDPADRLLEPTPAGAPGARGTPSPPAEDPGSAAPAKRAPAPAPTDGPPARARPLLALVPILAGLAVCAAAIGALVILLL